GPRIYRPKGLSGGLDASPVPAPYQPMPARVRGVSAGASACQSGVRPLPGAPPTVIAMTNYAIEAEGLTKRFGKTQALAGIDLAAREGTVLGVLGPTGAR